MSCLRFYTHSIVTYNSLDCCFELFNQAKHFAYIIHDRDKTDEHIHILATFSREKSFTAVRKMVIGEQNTFTQECRDVESLLDYFLHDNEPDKERYSPESIYYDDEVYWKKRVNDGEVNVDKNDMFVDDLMSPEMTVNFMARKYGRDFIKNYRSYLEFRKLLSAELTFNRKGDDYNNVDFSNL